MRVGTILGADTKAVGTKLGVGNPSVQSRGVASYPPGFPAEAGMAGVSTVL